MKKLNWFKPSRHGFCLRPSSTVGWLIALIFLAGVIYNFWRIDSTSHSVSDTLINFIPQTIIIYAAYLLIAWLSSKTFRWPWGGKMLLVYTTFPNQKEALKICNQLAKERLIACANLNQIESRYIWEGEIMESTEVTGFLKTTCWNFSELKKRLTEIHPYEVPCIIKIKAEANRDYFEWLSSVVKK